MSTLGKNPYGEKPPRFYSQVVLAGGINIAEELTSSEEPEVSAEWIVEMDPDIIVREASGMGYMAENTDKAKEIYDELVGRGGLAMTKAVQNKNVHIVCVFIRKPPPESGWPRCRLQSKSALRQEYIASS